MSSTPSLRTFFGNPYRRPSQSTSPDTPESLPRSGYIIQPGVGRPQRPTPGRSKHPSIYPARVSSECQRHEAPPNRSPRPRDKYVPFVPRIRVPNLEKTNARFFHAPPPDLRVLPHASHAHREKTTELFPKKSCSTNRKIRPKVPQPNIPTHGRRTHRETRVARPEFLA